VPSKNLLVLVANFGTMISEIEKKRMPHILGGDKEKQNEQRKKVAYFCSRYHGWL